MNQRSYRVIVRGQFDGLDDAAKAALRAVAHEHDLLNAGFTEEGTITYATDLKFFTFRCLAQGSGDLNESERQALRSGQEKAAVYLDAKGFGYKQMNADAMNMDDIRIRRKGRP
jgi:hypothetical protein